MFQEHLWLAQADARAVDPAETVNGRDHAGDRPGDEPAPDCHRSTWRRLVDGFPWHEGTQRR